MTDKWLTLQEPTEKYTLREMDILFLVKDQKLRAQTASTKDGGTILLISEEDLSKLAFIRRRDQNKFKDIIEKAAIGVVGGVSAHLIEQINIGKLYNLAIEMVDRQAITALPPRWSPEMVVIPPARS